MQESEEQEKEEEDPLKDKEMDPTTYSILEDQLMIRVEEEKDPILKANMQ